MPTFAGVDHLALTVTDLDVSQRFYTELFGFVVVMDVGYGRITCTHPPVSRWRCSSIPTRSEVRSPSCTRVWTTSG